MQIIPVKEVYKQRRIFFEPVLLKHQYVEHFHDNTARVANQTVKNIQDFQAQP